jgi:tRNA 2-thiocytidine biosynthesis protein TtcA
MFSLAKRFGCNKVALGHHKDDIVETLLLNIFYSAEISTMLPIQPMFNGIITLIRPLALLEERKIERFAKELGLPCFPCGCPASVRSKRKEVKELIGVLEKKNHRIKGNIFRSLSNIKLEYTLMNSHPNRSLDDGDVK